MMDEQYFHDFASEIYCCEETIDEIIVSLKQIALDARREALGEARGVMYRLAESHPDVNVNIENGWIKLSDIIAAISSLEVK
jgi:hypothetical protein